MITPPPAVEPEPFPPCNVRLPVDAAVPGVSKYVPPFAVPNILDNPLTVRLPARVASPLPLTKNKGVEVSALFIVRALSFVLVPALMRRPNEELAVLGAVKVVYVLAGFVIPTFPANVLVPVPLTVRLPPNVGL